MIIALKIIIVILSLFSALCLCCALWVGLRRDTTQADPFFEPFGDMPGFSREELEMIATRLPPDQIDHPLLDGPLSRFPSAGALRRDAGGGRSDVPSGASAVRNALSPGD